MARECAAGKGRALVLPGGRTSGRCVQESPICSPTPRCPREHTFPLDPSGFSARTSQPPKIQYPLLSGEHRRTGSLDLLPRAPIPSPLGYTQFWDPGPLLSQEYRKLGPRPNGRPRVKILDLFPLVDSRTRGPSPSPVKDPGTRADSPYVWGNISLCPALPLSP